MDGLLFRGTKWLLAANFYLSVVVLIGIGFASLGSGFDVLEFNEDLYGPMANNLRFMLLYLAIAEIFIVIFAFVRRNSKVFIASGFFLVLCIGSLKFYSMINNVEVDENFYVFFLYVGLSHIVFGIAENVGFNKRRQPWASSEDRLE